jgi:hypothetical protein
MKYFLMCLIFLTSTTLSAHQKKNGGTLIDQQLAIMIRQSLLYFEELKQSESFQEQEKQLLIQKNHLLLTEKGIDQFLTILYQLKNIGSDGVCFDQNHEQQNICLTQSQNDFLLHVNGAYYSNVSKEEFIRDLLFLILQEVEVYHSNKITSEQTSNLAERIAYTHQLRLQSETKSGAIKAAHKNAVLPGHTMTLGFAIAPELSPEINYGYLRILPALLTHSPEKSMGIYESLQHFSSIGVYSALSSFSFYDKNHYDLSLGLNVSLETLYRDTYKLGENGKATKLRIMPYCIACVPYFAGLHFSAHKAENETALNLYLVGINSFYQYLDHNSFLTLHFNSALGLNSLGDLAVRGEMNALYLYMLPSDLFHSLGIEGRVDYVYPLNITQIEVKALLGLGEGSYFQLFTGPQVRLEGSLKNQAPRLWNVGLQLRY